MHVLVIIASVGGACGAIAVIFKVLMALARIATGVEKLLPIADTLQKEFRSNGGSTLRDRVDALATTLNAHREEAGKRMGHVESQISDLKKETMDRLSSQDKTLGDIANNSRHSK